MYNLYTKFVKILERCKQFSENLVNESGGAGSQRVSAKAKSARLNDH